MEKSNSELKIYAYGFLEAGFKIPRDEFIDVDGLGTIEFVGFDDKRNLDEVDGLIIPQGVFEKIERAPNEWGEIYTDISSQGDLLLEKERQVLNLINEGKWICFLVGEIIDQVPQGLSSQDIRDTDLCKRILNRYRIQRSSMTPNSDTKAKYNEFFSYIKQYGVAKTLFRSYSFNDKEINILAEANGNPVGIEIDNQVFFVPFHSPRNDYETTENIVSLLGRALYDYIQKNTIYIPKWLEEFQFKVEKSIRKEIIEITERQNTLENDLIRWINYKAILTTSGNVLKKIVIEIMQDFFEFHIDPIDEGREDFKIVNEEGEVLAVVEVKGTKKGIKREHINQADSHRERNDLPSSIPSILIINNEMGISGLKGKIESDVPDEQIKHARNLNVLIVRTIDLLLFMSRMENVNDRKEVFLDKIRSESGWINIKE